MLPTFEKKQDISHYEYEESKGYKTARFYSTGVFKSQKKL
jgi:hypothetical protein